MLVLAIHMLAGHKAFPRCCHPRVRFIGLTYSVVYSLRDCSNKAGMRIVEGELCAHCAWPTTVNEGYEYSGGGSTKYFYWSLFMGQLVPVALLDRFPVLISLESSSER